MAQFVNKLRDCMRTVNLTMLLVLNLFFIVTLNLTVVTVLVVSEADHGFFIQDGSVSIGGALVILYASCILMAVSLVVAIRLVLIKPIKNIIQAMNRLAAGDFTVLPTGMSLPRSGSSRQPSTKRRRSFPARSCCARIL